MLGYVLFSGRGRALVGVASEVSEGGVIPVFVVVRGVEGAACVT